MKTLQLLLAFFILSYTLVSGQKKQDTRETDPDKYTFEKAAEFEKKGELDKAVWFYINLYPENKEKVIANMKAFAARHDTLKMDVFIKKSFGIYATFDPAISNMDNGKMNMDMAKLKEKGNWGDELIVKISDPAKPLSTAKEYNLRSLDKSKAKDYKGALDDLNKAIEMEPTGQYYYNRAYTKSMMEDYKGSIEDFNKTIELQYRLASAYYERGYCKDKLNDFEGTIADYTSAINTKANYLDAYNNRAFTYYNHKKYDEALKDYNKVIELDPKYVSAYISRGFLKYSIRDPKGACADWQKAYDLGDTESKTYMDKYCK